MFTRKAVNENDGSSKLVTKNIQWQKIIVGVDTVMPRGYRHAAQPRSLSFVRYTVGALYFEVDFVTGGVGPYRGCSKKSSVFQPNLAVPPPYEVEIPPYLTSFPFVF